MANKYLNQKTVVGGLVFASKKEAKRYRELTLMKQKGLIADLVVQPRFPFIINKVPLKTGDKGSRTITYVADFKYRDKNGNLVVEDVKSSFTKKNPTYKIKKALMNVLYKIQIKEV